MRDAEALVFGEVAELYDRMRPGYPAALYDELLSAVPNPRRALEAGAATGRVTVALARRGLEIDALEPDPRMAAIRRRRSDRFSVRVCTSFRSRIGMGFAVSSTSSFAARHGIGSTADVAPQSPTKLSIEMACSRSGGTALARGPWRTTSYRWEQTYDSTSYCDLLTTQADHRLLPPEQLQRLVAGVHDAVEPSGDSIRYEFTADLSMATPRRPS